LVGGLVAWWLTFSFALACWWAGWPEAGAGRLVGQLAGWFISFILSLIAFVF